VVPTKPEVGIWQVRRIGTDKRLRALEVPCAFPKVQTAGMANKKRKRTPKTVLKLPDLEQSKSAVLNSLTCPSSQRSYDRAIREFIDWYCSEPRLAFNKTVVTRYRISLEPGPICVFDYQPATRRHSPACI
jgi:hypothetical protein